MPAANFSPPRFSCRVPTPSPPQDKHRLYLNRLNLLLQRLRRNRRFQPPNPLQRAAGAAPQAHLTELMGLKGSAGETCIVMGIIGSQVMTAPGDARGRRARG